MTRDGQPGRMRVLTPDTDDPHRVTVLEAGGGAGVELMRTRTTGGLSLFHVPSREVARLRAALEKWEADHQ